MSTTPSASEQTRGLVIVIVLSVLATVGMFMLIITLVILKNKRDRRKREVRLNSSDPTAYIGGAGMIDPMYHMASGGPGAGGMGGGLGGMVGGGSSGGKRGRYQKLGGEEADAGGVWSVEMDERHGGQGGMGSHGGERSGERYEMSGSASRDADKDTYR